MNYPLESMSLKELATLYNTLVDESKHIKRFKDKRTAMQRIKIARQMVEKKPTSNPQPVKKKKSVEQQGGKTIGQVICAGISAGYSTQDILETVHKQFPNAKTKAASVAWYRNQLRHGRISNA